MQIFIGNEALDLPEGNTIPLNFQVNSPESIDSFQTDFSQTFNVLATPKNDRLLGFPTKYFSTTTTPYELIDCFVLDKGVIILRNPKLIVSKITRNSLDLPILELQIFGGTLDFFSAISNKTLQDLDLSVYDHEMILGQQQQTNDYTDGYIYDLINRAEDNQMQKGLFSWWTPSVFVLPVLEQICVDAGFTLSFPDGLPTTPVDIEKLILPHTEAIRPCINNIAKRHSGQTITNFNANISGVVFSNFLHYQNDTLTTQTNTPEFDFNIVPYDDGTYQFPFATDAYICNEDKLFVYIDLLIGIGIGDVVNSLELRVYDSNEVIKSSFPIIAGATKIFVYLELLDKIRIFIDGSIKINTSTLTYFRVTVVDHEAVRKELWEIAPNLAPINQKDFFKTIAIFYGLYPFYNSTTNEIELRRFDNILDFNEAIDFSAKVDYSKQFETTFAFGNFAQENYFGWKNLERSGLLLNDDERAEKEKVIYTSPLGLVLDTIFVGTNTPVEILSIPTHEDITPNIARQLKELGKKTEAKIAFLEAQNPNVSFVIFGYGSDYVDTITEGFEITNIKTSTTAGLDWQEAINDNYNAIKALLLNSRKEIIYIKFELKDLLMLDFSKPIWIGNNYNSYFYLSKIVQYTDNVRSVRCEMFRISNNVAPLPTLFLFQDGNDFIFQDGNDFIFQN